MKRITMTVVISVVVVFVVTLLSPMAFAATAKEQPTGEPPFGVAIQSDAQGTKLNGAVLIEYYNFRQVDGQLLADARIVLRLRKGSVFKTFFGEETDIDTNDPAGNQQTITETMYLQIINEFFEGDTSLEITLKSLEEFGDVDAYTALTPGGSSFVLSDLIIAVK
jgi:hypothetical protein